MKALLYVVIMIAVMPLGHGQSISIGFGPTYITDKSEVDLHPNVKGSGWEGNDDWFYQISYNHKLGKKGIVQPDAINFTDGAGRFYAVGLGYRFGKRWSIPN